MVSIWACLAFVFFVVPVVRLLALLTLSSIPKSSFLYTVWLYFDARSRESFIVEAEAIWAVDTWMWSSVEYCIYRAWHTIASCEHRVLFWTQTLLCFKIVSLSFWTIHFFTSHSVWSSYYLISRRTRSALTFLLVKNSALRTRNTLVIWGVVVSSFWTKNTRIGGLIKMRSLWTRKTFMGTSIVLCSFRTGDATMSSWVIMWHCLARDTFLNIGIKNCLIGTKYTTFCVLVVKLPTEAGFTRMGLVGIVAINWTRNAWFLLFTIEWRSFTDYLLTFVYSVVEDWTIFTFLASLCFNRVIFSNLTKLAQTGWLIKKFWENTLNFFTNFILLTKFISSRAILASHFFLIKVLLRWAMYFTNFIIKVINSILRTAFTFLGIIIIMLNWKWTSIAFAVSILSKCTPWTRYTGFSVQIINFSLWTLSTFLNSLVIVKRSFTRNALS